jgi:antitoxin component YwqK of YwqJK toxin-antitoxin module
MNRIIKILIIVLTPLSFFGQEINSNQLEIKDQLFYVQGEESPYNGTAITYSKDNKKQSSIEYISGLPNGTMTAWYPDGVKQVEGEIIGVSKKGKWIAWYQNGNKIREGVYKNNKEEGLFTWWFENGNLNKKGNYEDGIASGKWEWYYENGKLKQTGSIKGEMNLGKWKDYYENGNPKNEGEFLDGKMEGIWVTWNTKGEKTIKEYKNGLLLSDNPDKNSYVEKMNYFLGERDFKNSLLNIQKAIETVSDKTENNPEYMTLVVLHSKVYSLFNHLDEAERVILKATGVPEKEIETIIESVSKESHFKLQKIAKSITKSKIAKNNIAPHITLNLIYNILGDSINLRNEQQLMMERSNTSDWVLSNSMAIYGIRASKEEGNGIVNEILEEVKTEGENHKNQLQLTYYLSTIGRFEEAEIITDRYLALNRKDVEFLSMQLNIEMSKGNTKRMQEIKEEILEINPKAFDE